MYMCQSLEYVRRHVDGIDDGEVKIDVSGMVSTRTTLTNIKVKWEGSGDNMLRK
jgi:hypothetical protein